LHQTVTLIHTAIGSIFGGFAAVPLDSTSESVVEGVPCVAEIIIKRIIDLLGRAPAGCVATP
jgi:hypothetical protein